MLGVCALTAASAPVFAHTFSTLRGMGIIEDGKLTLTLSGGAEDYLHDGELLPSGGRFLTRDVEACAGRYGEALLERLVLRDDQGRRIDGRVLSAGLSGSAARAAAASSEMTYDELRRSLVEYVLRYDVSGAGRYLSFQQRPSDDAGTLLTRIDLTVREAGVDGLMEIALTGGGNVEVVNLQGEAANASPAGPFAETSQSAEKSAGSPPRCDRSAFILIDAFKTLRGVVEISGDRVDVSIYLPAPMVETWMPMPRAARDFLDPAEQAAAAADFARLCAERIRLDLSNGATSAVANVDNGTTEEQNTAAATATFLDVGEIEGKASAARARLSYWTSRVFVKLSYAVPSTAARVTIEWRLFNSAVVAAPLLIIADGQCREQDVSTYAATVALPRAAPLSDRGG